MRGLYARQVVRLARVGVDVVELTPGRGDELVAPVADRRQLAPAVVITRIPGLAERQQIERLPTRRAAAGSRPDTPSGFATPSDLENRRHHVDDAHLIGDDANGQSRSRDDERNVHGRVVDKEAVLLLAVLTQRFAVIANDDDEGAFQTAGGLEMLPSGGRPARRSRRPRRRTRPAPSPEIAIDTVPAACTGLCGS